MAENSNTNAGGVDIDDIRWQDRATFIDKRVASGCSLIDAFIQDPLPKMCEEVFFIRNSKARKMYFEAALLTESSYGDIADILDSHTEIVELYAKVFFDVQSMDRISKVEVIENCKEESERNLKLWAMTQGLQFIAWRLGKPVKMSPTEGLSSLMSDSYFKAKEAFFNNSTSASSQQALRWTKQTIELAKLLKAWVSDESETYKDIEFALRDFTEEELQFDLLDALNLEEEPLDADFTELQDEADDT